MSDIIISAKGEKKEFDGLVAVNNVDYEIWKKRQRAVEAIRRVSVGIVRTFQPVSVFDTPSVLENIMLARIRFDRSSTGATPRPIVSSSDA